MCAVDGYIAFDCRLHDARLRILTAYLLETMEKKGMMGNDELTAEHNGFIDHLRRNVCGQKNGVNIAFRVTYL